MRSHHPLLLALLLTACGSGEAPSFPRKADASFAVEGVRVDSSAAHTWYLHGMVRNTLDRPAKIAVRIKMKNAKGDIVNTTKAVVNGYDALDAGVAGPFTRADDPEAFQGVVDFDVEPYER